MSSTTFYNKPLINPFLAYHNQVQSSFQPLSNVNRWSKLGEVVKRICCVVVAPLAYIALALIAGIGLSLNGSYTTQSTTPGQNSPKPQPTSAYQDLIKLCSASGKVTIPDHNFNQITYGSHTNSDGQKVVYVELYDKGLPVHYNVYANGKIECFDRHYHSADNMFNFKVKHSELPDRMSVLQQAIDAIKQPSRPKQKGPSSTRKFDNLNHLQWIANGIVINGALIPAIAQEKGVGNGYNWVIAYDKKETISQAPGSRIVSPKLEGMQQFAKNAHQQAFIAYHGVFSNYQMAPFSDPVEQVQMPSGEHMFHYYKFPPNSTARNQILIQGSPDSARITAQSIGVPPTCLQQWVNCNLKLMVFIQLAKALEASTGFQQGLNGLGNRFIIEDTSLRNGSNSPEKFWGDNGDGAGRNQLGWAQMKAREIINQGHFNQQAVVKYFNAEVKPLLNIYYAAYNS